MFQRDGEVRPLGLYTWLQRLVYQSLYSRPAQFVSTLKIRAALLPQLPTSILYHHCRSEKNLWISWNGKENWRYSNKGLDFWHFPSNWLKQDIFILKRAIICRFFSRNLFYFTWKNGHLIHSFCICASHHFRVTGTECTYMRMGYGIKMNHICQGVCKSI